MLPWLPMSGSGVIILFGGTSNERRVSVASAQHIAAVLDEAAAWFLAPGGAVHPVTDDELAGFERAFERDFKPAAATAFRTVVARFESQPSQVCVLALHGGVRDAGSI